MSGRDQLNLTKCPELSATNTYCQVPMNPWGQGQENKKDLAKKTGIAVGLEEGFAPRLPLTFGYLLAKLRIASKY